MDTVTLLQMCESENVKLGLDGDQLDVMFDDMPSDVLIEALKDNKEQLVDLLTAQSQKRAGDDLVSNNETQGPLSFGQRRLWFLDRFESGSSQYNMPIALEIEGKLDLHLLEKAFNHVVEKHQILRTTYALEGTVQIVESVKHLAVERVQPKTAADRTTQIESFLNEHQGSAFNLNEDAMVKAAVLSLSDSTHVLSVVMHHIASDGWSLGVFVNELTNAYQRLNTGEVPLTDSLELQYLDYAVWQNNHASDIEDNAEYWTSMLKGAPELHDLPTDYARPRQQSFAGAKVERYLPKDIHAKALKLCQSNGLTPFMFYYSAFSLLVSKWSNEADIVIGTPIANRDQLKLEPLIGYFANTLALRTTHNRQWSFDDLLHQNKSMLAQAFERQNVPFEMVVDKVQPKRSLSHSPLFQILFSFHSHAQHAPEIPGLSISEVSSSSSSAKYDIELAVVANEGALNFTIQYATSLFEKSSIERLLDSLFVLIADAVNNSDKLISELAYLPNSDKEKLETFSHCLPTKHVNNEFVFTQVSRIANQFPERIALAFGEQRISYMSLEKKSNQVAHSLIARGVDVGDIIGIQIERSIEMVIAMLGVLKAGGAYLPLETHYPATRINFMKKDSQLKLVLTSEELLATNLDQYAESGSGLPQLSQEDLAYVIYTSGSTGKPKGVTISHQNMMTFLSACQPLFNQDQGCWLAVTGISFDISVLEIFGSLANGYQVIVADSALSEGGIQLADVIEDNNVTDIQCTPSFALMHLASLESLSKDTCLRNIYLGGEPFPTELIPLASQLSNTQLHNMYGPTEATVWATTYSIKPDDIHVPIGRPLAGYQCYVFDRDGQTCPIGARGELFIAGDAIAYGYLNREELTESRFSTHSATNKRMYATGDLVKWNKQGQLEFLGRIDSQVKLRGHRIELGEIEQLLALLPSVKSVAVLLQERTANDERLVAFVQAAHQQQDTTQLQSTLVNYLKLQLPAYMVPANFVFVTDMPMTLNGKLDRKALMDMEVGHADMAIVEPITDIEEKLRDLWAELLVVKAESISTSHNFFELGGHSLLLSQMVIKVKSLFNVDISMKDVFELSTIQALSAKIAQLVKEKDTLARAVQTNGEQTEAIVL